MKTISYWYLYTYVHIAESKGCHRQENCSCLIFIRFLFKCKTTRQQKFCMWVPIVPTYAIIIYACIARLQVNACVLLGFYAYKRSFRAVLCKHTLCVFPFLPSHLTYLPHFIFLVLRIKVVEHFVHAIVMNELFLFRAAFGDLCQHIFHDTRFIAYPNSRIGIKVLLIRKLYYFLMIVEGEHNEGSYRDELLPYFTYFNQVSLSCVDLALCGIVQLYVL